MSGSSDPKPAPASVEPPRVIPGLSTSTTPTPSSKPRKRSAKKKDASTPFAGTVEGEATTPSDVPVPVPVETGAGAGGEEDLVIPEKQTSAVEVVQKRIRSANKKIQRIEGYEASTTALNADQQRAVQGKPVLEAVIRELTELLGVLKAEDAEEETRLKRVAVVEEKKQARAIDAAVQASKDEAQSQLVLLFQFLHLFSLFNPQSAFAPPALPAALANATENDVATVRYLYAQFADGPLLGGRDDAIEKLAKIAEGRDEVVLEELGVTFARIQQLLHGMTAPPQTEIPQEDAGLVTPNEQPAGPADSVVALIDGATEEVHAPPAPSFLQPSEVEQTAAATPPAEEKVQNWAEELSQAQAPPPSAPATPTTETANIPTTPAPNGHADFAAPPAAPQTQTLDWAAEDEGGLPHLPELAPPVPVVSVPSSGAQAAPLAPATQQQQMTPSTSSDGFVPARQPRRTGSERGPRGAGGGGPHRGGRGRGRGRGGFNGERTGSFEGQGGQGGAAGEGRPPRPDRQDSGEGRRGLFRGAGRGGPRGGGGRGGRGGKGGAQQGAAGQPTTHPAPAPTA